MRCLSSDCSLQLFLNRSSDVVRLANGQFTGMGLEPLKQFVGGHHIQGHNGPVVSSLDVLRIMQGLAREVFGQQRVGFKNNFFRSSLSQYRDAQGMGEVVVRVKGSLDLKFGVLMRFDVDDAVTTERADALLAWIPAEQVPPVSVFLQQVRMQRIGVRDITFFTEFSVGESDFMMGANGLKQRPQMRRTRGVGRAFELDDVVIALGVQIGRNRETIRDFTQGLIELLENGEVAKLDQRVGGKSYGVEVVVVQLHVIDAVPFLRVVVSSFVTMVFDGRIESQIRFIAHGPEVFLDGRDADVFAVAAVKRVLTGLPQVFLCREGFAGIGQATVDDAVAQQSVFVGRHEVKGWLLLAERTGPSWPVREGRTGDRGFLEGQ